MSNQGHSEEPSSCAPELKHPANRLGFIDAIRGIAAMAVVVAHSLESWNVACLRWTTEIFSFGMFGVVAFLFVSGFVVPACLERTASLAKFWVGRCFRLYPLYWLSLVLVLPLIFNSGPQMGFNPHNTLHWLANITMLQQFIGVGHAQGSYWTLTVELVLYVTYSLLFLRGWIGRSLTVGWVMATIAFVLAVVLPIALDRRLPGGSSGEYVMCILMAFAGTAAFRYYNKEIGVGQFAALTTFIFLVGIGIGYTLYGKYRAGANVPFSLLAVELSWVAAFILVIAALCLHRVNVPPLAYLGRISYSIYLLHTVPMSFVPRTSATVFIVGVCLCSVALSSVTYRFIEAPLERYGKELRAKMGRRASLPKRLEVNRMAHVPAEETL